MRRNKRCFSHFLLRSQFLVPRSILQHSLVVFIPFILQLFMLLLFNLPQCCLEALFQFLLLSFELGNLIGSHASSIVQVVIEFVNFCFLLVGAHLVVHGLRTVVRGLVLLLG